MTALSRKRGRERLQRRLHPIRRPDPPLTRAAVEYERSVRHVLEAFATPGLLDRGMYLPEVRGGMTLPAATAIGLHLVDYVTHGWDVAKAIGAPIGFDKDVLHTALAVAEAVPEQAKSLDLATPFHPSVPTTGTRLLDRVVATLGRNPGWKPAQ